MSGIASGIACQAPHAACTIRTRRRGWGRSCATASRPSFHTKPFHPKPAPAALKTATRQHCSLSSSLQPTPTLPFSPSPLAARPSRSPCPLFFCAFSGRGQSLCLLTQPASESNHVRGAAPKRHIVATHAPGATVPIWPLAAPLYSVFPFLSCCVCTRMARCCTVVYPWLEGPGRLHIATANCNALFAGCSDVCAWMKIQWLPVVPSSIQKNFKFSQ
mmetsp:Transcript_58550/g.134332  ORF Transcript_58550/g.134332 Transcript_58550/m.134332 type:complete len:217 (+) Transcript_58550:352-1002(+)